MSEESLKKLNSTQTIINTLPIIIEAFVTFYGESERKTIEEKFRNLLVIGYSKPTDMDSVIYEDKNKKSATLIEQFLNKLNIPEEEKNKFKQTIFANSTLEYVHSHPIYNYISYINGDTRFYYKNQTINFLSQLFPSLQITEDNLDELIKQGKFQSLEATIELYNGIIEEYKEYLSSIQPYTDYTEKCKKLQENLKKKYTKILVDELKDLFTEEELRQIEEKLSSPYHSSIYDINGKTRNIFSYNLNQEPLIESFSQENEELLLTGNKWQKDSVKKDRIQYFKNFGLDLGDDYETYMNDNRIKGLIPSKEIIERIKNKRNEMYTMMMNEYYNSIMEYQKNRERIDRLDLVDKEDGYNANAYENSRICVSTNIKRTETGYVMHPLLLFYINNYDSYLDPTLIHELNHVYELHLERVEENIYYGTCGWDIIDTVISKEKESTVSLEERKEKRNYELFNEIINELISQEICQILFDSGHRIFSSKENTKIKGGTSYEYTMFIIRDFYETYKKEIIDSRKNGDMTVLFEVVGKENFEALNELFHLFYEYFPGMSIYTAFSQFKNNEETELTQKLKEIIIKRNQILLAMEEHSKKNSQSL